ncbi:MAG: hypothetical protein ACLFQ0_13905 [Cyclobacteriaceae bacterium]
MHLFQLHLLFICLLMITSCDSGSSSRESKEQQVIPQPIMDQEGVSGTLIVTTNEQYQQLYIKVMDNMLQQVRHRDTVDLSIREGIICQNQPKNPGIHYGFQTDNKLQTYYIAMYEGSAVKGTYEWCRLYEYKPSSESWKQLINFGNIHQPIWIYMPTAGKIVYLDTSTTQLKAYDLTSGTDETIAELTIDTKEHALRAEGSEVILSHAVNMQVRELRYDFSSKQLEQQVLAPATDFSSIYQDYVLQTYYKGESEQGFRLYQKGELVVDQPFTIGNVNSFWNSKGQFYLLGEKQIFLMNPQLDTLGQADLNSPFIYNVLDAYIVAHARQQDEVIPYLLVKDLSGKQRTTILENAAWNLLVKEL